jgi:hypothetical protein
MGFGVVAVAVVPDRRPRRFVVISKTWLKESEVWWQLQYVRS